MTEWIRCEDRLPEAEQMCLVFIPSLDDHVTMGEFMRPAPGFWINRQVYTIFEVTHWAPLPEPPREANDD